MGIASQHFLANAVDSPSSATTEAQSGVGGFSGCDAITIIAELQGADDGTVDVFVQHSHDGVEWFDYVHFAQLGVGAAAVTYHYAPALNDSIVTIGSGTTPLLANGSVAGGHWMDFLRVVMVAAGSVDGPAEQTVRVHSVRKN